MKTLRRIYNAHAYDTKAPVGSYWDATLPAAPAYPALDGDRRTGVAIIGAGYTGLSAALHLARDHGERAGDRRPPSPAGAPRGAMPVFCGFAPPLRRPSWGDSAIIGRFGEEDLRAFYSAQKRPSHWFAILTSTGGIAADVQEDGEYCLAHQCPRGGPRPAGDCGRSRPLWPG
ncbi:hypothetical protein K3552_18605 (plasmid) [Leisingera aquaemixtae]|uniref:hypothetical protein n=1 Tax=Leisingera aquaemixtae TaxID=1396826 RepID=UPI0021A8BC31|nr:hypothetical protein [Leisingera aquaemixtae]UWQ39416.1 hypothetical protein K3552_18605 [Leisingera aquaemixtae]